MMRYLLDTHAILWYADAAQELPLAMRDLMDSSECFYSVASLWEIAIKKGLGRLNCEIAVSEYDGICRQAGFRRLSILPSHLDRICYLPDIHRDPFDRILVAQAQEEHLVLATRDRVIPQYPVETFWCK